MSKINKNCIYRDFNNNGNRCSNHISDLSNHFCIKHINNKNYEFYYIINNQIKHYKSIKTIDIINLYIFLYKYEYEYNYIYKLFKFILKNNKNKLYIIYNNLGLKLNLISFKNISKNKLIKNIINKLQLYSNTFFLKNTKYKVIKIQKLWRKYINNISGINLGISHNDCDIFSFDNINNIEYPFQFIDNNIIYCFDSINLLHHIKNNNFFNPYTMNIIDNNIIDRLYHYIYIKDIYIDDDEYKWFNITNAFTDVSIKLDKFGYYTDIRWYYDLDFDTIINILNTYHKYIDNINYLYNNYLCCNNFYNKYPDYIYKFCEMVIDMLNDTIDPSTHAFIFFKSLTENSLPFYNGSPDWL
jgi:hypothetical protein